jgi:hypothetical protein
MMNMRERERIELLKSGRSKEVEEEGWRQTKDSIPLRERRDSVGTSSTDKEYR